MSKRNLKNQNCEENNFVKSPKVGQKTRKVNIGKNIQCSKTDFLIKFLKKCEKNVKNQSW